MDNFLEFKPRKCLNCGGPLPPHASKNRKYCDTCRDDVNRKKAREYDKRQREKEKAKRSYADPNRWKPKEEDIKYCKNCIYREANYWQHLCNYYIRTGKRRGCKAGKGCNKREIRSSLNGKGVKTHEY